LHGNFVNSLQNLLQNPGMSQDSINAMIGRANDTLNENAKQQRLSLEARANVMGGGVGGASPAALRHLNSDYAGQRADQARQIQFNAEQDRLNRYLSSLGVAGNFLSHVEDSAAAQARFQQQMLMELMNHRPATPNYMSFGSGLARGGGGSGGSSGGFNFGVGGLANASDSSNRGGAVYGGEQSGSLNFPTYTPAPAPQGNAGKPWNPGGTFSPSQGGVFKPAAPSGGSSEQQTSYYTGQTPQGWLYDHSTGQSADYTGSTAKPAGIYQNGLPWGNTGVSPSMRRQNKGLPSGYSY
jgi:hypothetical protein